MRMNNQTKIVYEKHMQPSKRTQTCWDKMNREVKWSAEFVLYFHFGQTYELWTYFLGHRAHATSRWEIRPGRSRTRTVMCCTAATPARQTGDQASQGSPFCASLCIKMLADDISLYEKGHTLNSNSSITIILNLTLCRKGLSFKDCL